MHLHTDYNRNLIGLYLRKPTTFYGSAKNISRIVAYILYVMCVYICATH